MIDPVQHGTQGAKPTEDDDAKCVVAHRLLRNPTESNVSVMRVSPGANPTGDRQQLDLSTQQRWLVKMANADRILVRRARRSAQASWLLQMVCANRALARQARRYIIEKEPAAYSKYLQFLKLIRHAKIFSPKTNVTNLRTAFLKACASADI